MPRTEQAPEAELAMHSEAEATIQCMRRQLVVLRRALIGMASESTGEAREELEALIAAACAIIVRADHHLQPTISPVH